MSEDARRPVVAMHWREVAASTQDSARELLAGGAEPPLAVATDDQRGGRGRLGRVWETPPGGGLALTLVHRPTAPVDARTWYPLAVGLGVLAALARSAGVEAAVLKWPNDVQDARGLKLAGILVETAADGSLLIGVGLNLRSPVLGADGEEVPGAVALDALAAADAPDQAPSARVLAEDLAAALHEELTALDAAGGDAAASDVAARYRESCITPGRPVRVELVGDADDLVGRAIGIDALGRLLVQAGGGRIVPVATGDVHHVRPRGPEGDTVDDRHVP